MIDLYKQLRVGNYIEYKLSNTEDWKALEIGHNEISYVRNHSDSCRPIPLTPTWLEKMGLKNVGFENWTNNDDDFQFQRYDSTQARIWWRGRYLGVCQNLEFVHQLQNLYYALTTIELIALSPT